ncbi:hypothetical protein [Paenibacillus sinopodophylli]|uniref:hypothetical protein n=1 Tax=Paenibacillus sinopodophylli TaxID=1837342 RepID=UPI00110CE9AD|nr:hypothetical protein [Paenibacillus sinopodophylli]
MNVFLLNTELQGTLHISTFLKDHYVGFDWPGVGDLEQVSKDEGQAKAVQGCDNKELNLLEQLQQISSFVYDMQDGDYLFMTDGDYVHMGDLGDYYYVDSMSADTGSPCHRRGVTWLKSLLRSDLHPELKAFVDRTAILSKLEKAVSLEQVEYWMARPAGQAENMVRASIVDGETINQALDILKKAMSSEDADRRERAAIAVLQFAKP